MITSNRTGIADVSSECQNTGKWNEILSKADVQRIWAELYRVVKLHPLVRKAQNAGLLPEQEKCTARLAQEFFVTLLKKDRFQYYLNNKISDSEIEAELNQVELANILTAELKKNYPESYRLARRITTLIKTSSAFKKFQRNKQSEAYGLAEWSDEKKVCSYQEAKERIRAVPSYKINITESEYTNDLESAISNNELERLIIRVLKAIDSPMDICNLRSLVISRLPVIDISIVPISEDEEIENKIETRETPQSEQTIDKEEAVSQKVEEFIKNLNQAVNRKTKQNRKIMIFWHCYLSDVRMTQEKVAQVLGVSESLVLDYCSQIESILRKLSFTDDIEAKQFEQKLKTKISAIISDKNTKKNLKIR